MIENASKAKLSVAVAFWFDNTTVVSDDVSTVDVTGLLVEVENGTVPE